MTIDYYFAPNSPFVYLGHARFASIAKAAGAAVRVLPIDLGKVFSVSGGCRWASGRRSARPTGCSNCRAGASGSACRSIPNPGSSRLPRTTQHA